MVRESFYLKIFLLFFFFVAAFALIAEQRKIRVYHFSVDGEKCDKKITPDDFNVIKEAIKAWEAFDYKKALFETFLPITKSKGWDEVMPKPGTAGQFIDDRKCDLLFTPKEGCDIFCYFGAYRLKLKERAGLLAFPDTHYNYYFILEDAKGKTVWKRKSPVNGGKELWCLPVLPFPNEAGICFFGGKDSFQSLALYILDISSGKIKFEQELPSEENFLGYCFSLRRTTCAIKPVYYNGFIIMRPSYEGSEYFQNKFKDTPLAVIDLRALIE